MADRTINGRDLSDKRASVAELAVVLLLVLIAAARVVQTYSVFNQTHDEPYNILRGMEWLQYGTYTYPHHPPLAPVLFAVGPLLDGSQCAITGNKRQDSNRVLYESDSYLRTLSLARAGNLVFLVAAACIVWRWGSWLYGRAGGVLALALFTSEPLLLAHSGIATTDLAVTATFPGLLLAYLLWLDQPSLFRSCVLGTAAGLALVSKFSVLVFFPICAVTIGLVRFLGGDKPKVGLSSRAVMGSLAMGLALWVVWLFYQGSFGTIDRTETARHVNRLLGAPSELPDTVDRVLELPIPAPQFVEGILFIADRANEGHPSYFMGERKRRGGHLAFFPVMLAVKLSLPFVLLCTIGAFFTLKQWGAGASAARVIPVACALCVVWAVLPCRINIGVRHLLPIVPLLALVAVQGTIRLWHSGWRQRWTRTVLVALLVWLVVSSWRAHPSYLAYFNELGGRDPSRIAVDSDLDWGQDLLRLKKWVEGEGIEDLSLAYFGTADPKRLGLTDYKILRPGQRAEGWIAVSLTNLRAREGFEWLAAHEPAGLVGDSIRLYYLPPGESP